MGSGTKETGVGGPLVSRDDIGDNAAGWIDESKLEMKDVGSLISSFEAEGVSWSRCGPNTLDVGSRVECKPSSPWGSGVGERFGNEPGGLTTDSTPLSNDTSMLEILVGSDVGRITSALEAAVVG